MFIVILLLAIQNLTLGTSHHQQKQKQKILQCTSPDTTNHPAYLAGFFHPYPNAGGGGERVLWTMVRAIQQKYPYVICVVYSGDQIGKQELLENVKTKFGLGIRPETVYVVELTRRWWIDHQFSRLTLLMQSLGSVVLATEAIHQVCPDVFIDTVGFAFTYPLVRLMSSKIPVVSYTHYPTISSDMQTRVSSREAGFNNREDIAGSLWRTVLKSVYYKVFGFMYGWAGGYASTVMTNSTWTHNHVVKLFGNQRMTRVVYPPCDTRQLAEFPITDRRYPWIVSLAQFRPEKNHRLQVEAFAMFLRQHPEYKMPEDNAASGTLLGLLERLKQHKETAKYPMLVMLGGARNTEDEARAEALRQLSRKLGVASQVFVLVNVGWDQVQEWLRLGKVGLHTMRDEHFGINVVEMMAAGLITVAHNSGGPKLDIIRPAIRSGKEMAEDEEPVGMVADTKEEFAEMIGLAIEAPASLSDGIRRAARQRAASMFSEAAFSQGLYRRFDPVVQWMDQQID